MGNNLKKLRELKGWTHEAAAAAMEMSRGGFIKLERGERLLDEVSIKKAADVFEVSREVVLAEQTPIKIMGRVGAGAMIEPEFEQVPEGGLSTVDLPFAVPDGIIGFEVQGDSMEPAYKSGDVILVWEDQKRPTTTFLGEEAAVKTLDGYRALKVVQRGRSSSTFNLHSHNARLIEDVKIEWVGEIYVIIKARQVASAHRTKHTMNKRKAIRRDRETEGMLELPLPSQRTR